MSPNSVNSEASSTGIAPEERLGQLVAGRLELLQVLGIGAYGVVYQAQDIFTGAFLAVKVLPREGLDERQKRFQQREIELHMKASQHRNIVTLHKVIETSECTFVILEYCPEGDLFTNITERGHYVGNDYLAKRIFLQLLDAVGYCHSLGIYHRDLKPENVLVCDGGMEVKLADFGLATTEQCTSDWGCGSTFYMSPECQQSSSRQTSYYASAPNDVWSLGVILVNLTCGRNPWKRSSQSDSTYRAFLRDKQFLRTILPISAELNNILQRVFDPNPATRITLPELRMRILMCPRLTNGPNPMDSPPLSEVSDPSEYQVSEGYSLPSPLHPEMPEMVTPPDTAPPTPHNQSVQGPFSYNKPLVSRSSDSSFSQYYEVSIQEATCTSPTIQSPTDYVSAGRTFWPFPFFRREEVEAMTARFAVQHHGIRVF